MFASKSGSYTPGSIAGLLHGNDTATSTTKNKQLDQLFSSPREATPITSHTHKQRQKKLVKDREQKRKRHLREENSKEPDNSEQKVKRKSLKKLAKTGTSDTSAKEQSEETKSTNSSVKLPNIPPGPALTADEDSRPGRDGKSDKTHQDRKEMRLKKKRIKEMNRDKMKRTVFVGNLPTSVTKKDLKNLLKDCGAVDTVRLRSAAPANPKMPKKGVVARKEFHPKITSINAYVVFKEEDSAKKATQLNGQSVDSQHICVDYLGAGSKHDHKRSLFVGNLPFDAEEEDVREHFTECGEVVNVRLVRDKFTRIGKGFGYVLFEDSSSVALALKFEGQKFKGRKLRLERSTEKSKSSETDKKPKKGKSKDSKVTSLKRKSLSDNDAEDGDDEQTSPKKKKKKDSTLQEFGATSKLVSASKLKEKKKKKLKHRLERKKKQKMADILTAKSSSSSDKKKPRKKFETSSGKIREITPSEKKSSEKSKSKSNDKKSKKSSDKLKEKLTEKTKLRKGSSKHVIGEKATKKLTKTHGHKSRPSKGSKQL